MIEKDSNYPKQIGVVKYYSKNTFLNVFMISSSSCRN